jgi:hypothetical protein
MVKLPDFWKTAIGRGGAANGTASPSSLLTEADLDLDSGDFDPDDPDLPDFVRDHLKEKSHDKQIATAFDHRQHQIAKARKEQDEGDRRLRAWQASEQYRRAIQELSADIADARVVASRAYERALKEQEQTHEALEDARGHALVLADGRHVYFTQDGRRLYGEDDHEIADRADIAEAQSLRREHPDATTHEEFIERRNKRAQADEKVVRLQTTLGRLDALDSEIKNGNLTPEQLAEIRRQKQDVIDAMPSDAREEYDRLQAARKNEQVLSYRAVDPAFASAPALSEQFHAAGAPPVQHPAAEESRPQAPSRAPAYRSAPDYSSP